MAWAEKRGDGPRPWRARFERPDGTVGQRSGFETKNEALDYGEDQESDARNGRYRDPQLRRTTVESWARQWMAGQELARTTMAKYEDVIEGHIIPKWGRTPIADLSPLGVNTWRLELKRRYSVNYARDIVTRLHTMLEDAIVEGIISSNPAQQQRRRGKRSAPATVEEVWAHPFQIIALAENMRLLGGDEDYLMFMTKGFTGMRWGELIGLETQYASAERIEVQWQYVEVDGHFFKEPPKEGSRRSLILPEFLGELWAVHLDRIKDREMAFTTRRGAMWRRSNFSRRRWRPALYGREAKLNHGSVRTPQITAVAGIEGMTPHGARHGHKVWLDEAGIPRVAVEGRLGHRLPGVEGTYSHVSPAMEKRIAGALQRSYERAVKQISSGAVE